MTTNGPYAHPFSWKMVTNRPLCMDPRGSVDKSKKCTLSLVFCTVILRLFPWVAPQGSNNITIVYLHQNESYASVKLSKIPRRHFEIKALSGFSELGKIFHKCVNSLCLQSHFQRFQNDIYNQNSKDIWSPIDGASEDIVRPIPASKKNIQRTLGGNILGIFFWKGFVTFSEHLCG